MPQSQYDFSNAVKYHVGKFPPKELNYKALIGPLGEAADSLARYDTKMANMVNSELLIAPLRRQDAVASSRMEGTISTIEELYQLEAETEEGDDSSEASHRGGQRNDAIETNLYSRALRDAQHELENGNPLSEHLIRGTHKQLLDFGRGASKQTGSYKSEQNYIGDGRGEIKYVPISPIELLPAMGDLFHFINEEESTISPLIRTAIAHVEFEALHPFEDGNGRIGRMLITFMLWQLKVLSKPHFFVSGYFEDHKDEYIECMREVSASDDWTGWILFFLRAMHEQAKFNMKTLDAISNLYTETGEQFRKILNSKYYDKALDFIFANPIFYNNRFIKNSDIPAPTARALSSRLIKAGLLRTIRPASGRRAALYAFDSFLDIIKI